MNERRRPSDWLRLLLPIAAMALLAVSAWKLGFFAPRGSHRIVAEAERVGGRRWLAATFIIVYALLGTLALPMTTLTYAAGAVFGVVRGSIYVWIATMLAAAASYFLARGLLASTARRLLGPHRDMLRELQSGKRAALTVFRMQLTPMIPFAAVTYAAGTAELPPRSFFAGSALGIIPGAVIATFAGDRLVAGVSGHDTSAVVIAIVIPSTLLGLSYLPKLIKKIRRS